ncbi:MAG TPA: substrate-binding domain-containing protein [Verrucomicrobiae bacterium]|jgi:DNA-binding transcriptional regulator YhcF (GntR family)|nr:substrate-binding domain-containing protein [Verrucomicrobiae bacterium]
MPRSRSDKVAVVKAKLIARLNDGFHRPGDRFLSNRDVANCHGLSYQTAHRVIAELESEGYLKRRAASGTYVAGKPSRLTRVGLCFNRRAAQAGTFGSLLLEFLMKELVKTGIPHKVHWADLPATFSPDVLPVLWEAPRVMQQLLGTRTCALLLNDRPAPGLDGAFMDAVTTDDFSAGICAAQVLTARNSKGHRFAIITGPPNDRRSIDRANGFFSRLPKAREFDGGDWFGRRVPQSLRMVLRAGPDGVFCVNDRIAAVFLECCQSQSVTPPPVIGHDNTPNAEKLHLTTIGLPWVEFATVARELVQSRLDGYSGVARQVILAQRPVFRLTA